MGYQSKTYSLSDEVVDAIESAKAGGTSPNKFLRQLMGLEDGSTSSVMYSTGNISGPSVNSSTLTSTNPAEIPGIQVGAGDLPKNAKCLHCPKKFAGAKGASICPECRDDGHMGDPRNCEKCGEGLAI